MTVILSPRELHIKEVTRALQRAVGGVEACAEITGKGKSVHSNYQSANKSEFLTIADLVKLEPVTRNSADYPVVTRMLCQKAGGVFVPLPEVDAGDEDLRQSLLELTEELGDLARDLRDAMADGKCDSPEASRLRKDLSRLLRTATSFDHRLEEIEAQR